MLMCVSKIRLMKYRLSYILGVLLVMIVGTFAGGSVAQSINSSDLSAVRVDELSDEQIRAYLTQATSSGLSDVEMERLAMERGMPRSEEHTSELQSRENLVCRLLLEKKKAPLMCLAQYN